MSFWRYSKEPLTHFFLFLFSGKKFMFFKFSRIYIFKTVRVAFQGRGANPDYYNTSSRSESLTINRNHNSTIRCSLPHINRRYPCMVYLVLLIPLIAPWCYIHLRLRFSYHRHHHQKNQQVFTRCYLSYINFSH